MGPTRPRPHHQEAKRPNPRRSAEHTREGQKETKIGQQARPGGYQDEEPVGMVRKDPKGKGRKHRGQTESSVRGRGGRGSGFGKEDPHAAKEAG